MIDHLPDPPQPGDTIPDFQRKAAAHVLAQQLWTTQVNATGDHIDGQADAVAAAVLAVNADADTAVAAAGVATSKRDQAVDAAGISTTKAGEASGSASIAGAKRQEAVDAAGVATQAKADTVQLKADTVLLKQAAQDAATAAAGSAAQAGAPLVATSTTSLPVQPGALTINVGSGKGFAEGQYVVIARSSDPATAMRGLVGGYTNSGAGPLGVTVDKADGTGTYNDWKISLAGRDAAGSSRAQVLVTTATVTAEQGKDYILQFAGVVTVTMPAAPVWGGASIGVVVANGRADNVVAWNGSKHMGMSETTMTINSQFAAPELLPTGATYGWAIK
ncbi:hypothetical protein [Xylophilus ampelinus]|uniref:Uncharacterized protein n=1 Tax=Xylophilus ampelinus TaxID=54067 RepID=A0A318SKB0_9BURK|nr:hypothetical protein [Xylophilus ampelinus]MCS4508885.1 hypothetical protein [Xylophilus ampelinus]PYE79454.1 hypothetical protein DFQ15_102187 [Xylophilus ampelinus]